MTTFTDQISFKAYLMKLSDAYYNTATPLVSDQQFDELVEQYEAKFGLKYVYIGKPNTSSTHNKVKLPTFMTSLNKCKDDHALELFKKQEIVNYVYSEKLDGISLMIHYTGLFTKQKQLHLYTRGDGEYGTDVSHLLSQLNIPSDIFPLHPQDAPQGELCIRGELIIPKSFASELGENLRNIVCGVVNAKIPDSSVLEKVQFIAYSIPSMSMLIPSETFKKLQQWSFNIPTIHVDKKCDVEHCSNMLNIFEQQSKYIIDGLVVAKDKWVYQTTNENPKHIIAFKRNKIAKQTTVKQVIWKESRYGTIHPRVEIEPVLIDGSTICFASGFNAQYIKDEQIGPGSIIEVVKSGEVIPDIVRVIQPSTVSGLPADLSIYEWEGVHLKMKASSAKQEIARLVYSLKILEAKGMSEATIEKLYNAGFTNELILWNTRVVDLLHIDGIKQKSAENIVAALQTARKNLTITKVLLLSACFSNFGERKLDKIKSALDVVSYIKQLKPIKDEDVIKILNSVSVISQAQAFIEGCQELRKNGVFLQLLDIAVEVETSHTNFVGDIVVLQEKQYDIKIVLTGFRDADLKSRCESKGIKVVDTMSKSVHYVIVKDEEAKEKSSSKVKEAIKNNVPILTKQDLVEMFLQ